MNALSQVLPCSPPFFNSFIHQGAPYSTFNCVSAHRVQFLSFASGSSVVDKIAAAVSSARWWNGTQVLFCFWVPHTSIFSTFSWFIVTLSWVLIALLRWSFFAVHFATVFRNRWKEEEMESILVLWFVCPLLNNSNVLVCCFWNCSTLSKTIYSPNLCFHHTSDVADLNVYEDCVMKKYIFPFLSCTLVLLYLSRSTERFSSSGRGCSVGSGIVYVLMVGILYFWAILLGGYG